MTLRTLLATLVLCALSVGAAAQNPAFDPRPTAGSAAASGADFTSARLSNSFFTATPYRGAFAPGSSTDGRWDLPWANYSPQTTDYGSTVGATVLEGDITTNTTLTTGTRYLLRGFVQVRPPAVLTIQPGVIIFGEQATRGSLIINRGAQIVADGRADAPIVFTSAQPVGSRAAGDWGGVIITGRASINAAGGEATLEGGTGATYGGGASPNDTESSGTLRYVRIEYAGIAFTPNNEINSLTMGGVGSGTVIDYVQCSFGGDDSFEWFGGTVNARHLIAYGGLDDDFDGDIGWRGNVQFALTVRDPAAFDISGSTSLEQDNQTTESTSTPRSAPTFSNISVFGPMTQGEMSPNALFTRALHFRRATQASLYNSVVLGWAQGLRLDGPNTASDAAAGNLVIRNTILAGATSTNQTTFDINAWFSGRPGNTSLDAGTDGGASAAGIANVGAFFVSSETAPLALEGYRLGIWPNPSSSSSRSIAVVAPEATDIQLSVVDVLGREVAQVANGPVSAGTTEFSLGADLPAGVYLARLQTNGGVLTLQFTVVR